MPPRSTALGPPATFRGFNMVFNIKMEPRGGTCGKQPLQERGPSMAGQHRPLRQRPPAIRPRATPVVLDRLNRTSAALMTPLPERSCARGVECAGRDATLR
jgi:hypothetical protein